MSKPKIGDKYIIEIDSHMTNKNGDLYGVKGFRSLVLDQNSLEKLMPYDADEAYAEGYTLAESKYREARHQLGLETYQRGLDDAWDAARKIALAESDGGMSTDAFGKVFGFFAASNILKNNTATEAIEKIREYEKQKRQETKIHIGDEVFFTMFGRKIKGIAVDREVDGAWNVVGEKGALMKIGTADLTKTGRHVDLSELFGGEDE